MQLTDRQIVGYQFYLSNEQDPEDLPELLPKVRPADAETPEFEHIYDRTPVPGVARRQVRCAHCGRRNHFHGYVLQYADGKRVLVGKDCGQKHYSLWFHLKEAEFSDLIARAGALNTLENARRQLPQVIGELLDVLDSGWPTEAAAPGVAWRKTFPKLSERVLGVEKNRLVANVQVRNYDAENQRDARIDREIRGRASAAGMDPEDYAVKFRDVLRSDPSLQKPPLTKMEAKQVGVLEGIEYIRTSLYKPLEKLQDALAKLEDDHDLCAFASNDTDTRAIFAKLARVRRNARHAIDLVNALSSADRFFSPQNLRALTAWTEQLNATEGSYSSEDSKLFLTLPAGQRFTFTPAVVVEPPKLQAVRDLLRALGDRETIRAPRGSEE